MTVYERPVVSISTTELIDKILQLKLFVIINDRDTQFTLRMFFLASVGVGAGGDFAARLAGME
jgi:hypothetical protein